mgnify:CR=1 FL=1
MAEEPRNINQSLIRPNTGETRDSIDISNLVDFSYAGYRYGEEIPNLECTKEVRREELTSCADFEPQPDLTYWTFDFDDHAIKINTVFVGEEGLDDEDMPECFYYVDYVGNISLLEQTGECPQIQLGGQSFRFSFRLEDEYGNSYDTRDTIGQAPAIDGFQLQLRSDGRKVYRYHLRYDVLRAVEEWFTHDWDVLLYNQGLQDEPNSLTFNIYYVEGYPGPLQEALNTSIESGPYGEPDIALEGCQNAQPQLQQIIDDNPGEVICLPKGLYRIDKDIDINEDRTVLRGHEDGTHLFFKGPSTDILDKIQDTGDINPELDPNKEGGDKGCNYYTFLGEEFCNSGFAPTCEWSGGECTATSDGFPRINIRPKQNLSYGERFNILAGGGVEMGSNTIDVYDIGTGVDEIKCGDEIIIEVTINDAFRQEYGMDEVFDPNIDAGNTLPADGLWRNGDHIAFRRRITRVPEEIGSGRSNRGSRGGNGRSEDQNPYKPLPEIQPFGYRLTFDVPLRHHLRAEYLPTVARVKTHYLKEVGLEDLYVSNVIPYVYSQKKHKPFYRSNFLINTPVGGVVNMAFAKDSWIKNVDSYSPAFEFPGLMQQLYQITEDEEREVYKIEDIPTKAKITEMFCQMYGVEQGYFDDEQAFDVGCPIDFNSYAEWLYESLVEFGGGECDPDAECIMDNGQSFACSPACDCLTNEDGQSVDPSNFNLGQGDRFCKYVDDSWNRRVPPGVDCYLGQSNNPDLGNQYPMAFEGNISQIQSLNSERALITFETPPAWLQEYQSQYSGEMIYNLYPNVDYRPYQNIVVVIKGTLNWNGEYNLVTNDPNANAILIETTEDIPITENIGTAGVTLTGVTDCSGNCIPREIRHDSDLNPYVEIFYNDSQNHYFPNENIDFSCIKKISLYGSNESPIESDIPLIYVDANDWEIPRIFDNSLETFDNFFNDLGNPNNAQDMNSHVISSGILLSSNRNITIKNSTMKKPQNRGPGGNGYLFNISRGNNDILVEDCEGYRGRHNFLVGSTFTTSGIVFNRIKSHGGWLALNESGTSGNYDSYGDYTDDDLYMKRQELEILGLGKRGATDSHTPLAFGMLITDSEIYDGVNWWNRLSDSGGAGNTTVNSVLWNNRAYDGIDEVDYKNSSIPGMASIFSFGSGDEQYGSNNGLIFDSYDSISPNYFYETSEDESDAEAQQYLDYVVDLFGGDAGSNISNILGVFSTLGNKFLKRYLEDSLSINYEWSNECNDELDNCAGERFDSFLGCSYPRTRMKTKVMMPDLDFSVSGNTMIIDIGDIRVDLDLNFDYYAYGHYAGAFIPCSLLNMVYSDAIIKDAEISIDFETGVVSTNLGSLDDVTVHIGWWPGPLVSAAESVLEVAASAVYTLIAIKMFLSTNQVDEVQDIYEDFSSLDYLYGDKRRNTAPNDEYYLQEATWNNDFPNLPSLYDIQKEMRVEDENSFLITQCGVGSTFRCPDYTCNGNGEMYQNKTTCDEECVSPYGLIEEQSPLTVGDDLIGGRAGSAFMKNWFCTPVFGDFRTMGECEEVCSQPCYEQEFGEPTPDEEVPDLIPGCKDEDACNYDANATTGDDGVYCEYIGDFPHICYEDTDGDGDYESEVTLYWCFGVYSSCEDYPGDYRSAGNQDIVYGCTDFTACNYDPSATESDNNLCDYGPLGDGYDTFIFDDSGFPGGESLLAPVRGEEVEKTFNCADVNFLKDFVNHNPTFLLRIGQGDGYMCDSDTPLHLDLMLLHNSDDTNCAGLSPVQICNEFDDFGNLTKLNLVGAGLQGRIPDSIGFATNLEDIDISVNGMYGGNFIADLPDSIGDLTNLKKLNLGGNKFYNEIPSRIGNLTNLTHLNLQGRYRQYFCPDGLQQDNDENYIPECINDGNDISTEFWQSKNDCTDNCSVECVHAGYNGSYLEGEIPHSMENLINLENLQIQRNILEGEIPDIFTNLTSLNTIIADRNKLEYLLPQSICDIVDNLSTFFVPHNYLCNPNIHCLSDVGEQYYFRQCHPDIPLPNELDR